jgi:hypothetical protein
MKKLMSLSIGLLLFVTGCATGEDKHEGTTGRPQPAVGTTFEDDVQTGPAATGTAPPGDTAGVHARRGTDDQIGPTGRGPDEDFPEAAPY